MKNTVVETKKDLAKLEAPVVRIEKKTEPLKKVEPLIVLENKEKKVDTSTLLEKKESKSVELKGMRVITKPVVPKEESVQVNIELNSRMSFKSSPNSLLLKSRHCKLVSYICYSSQPGLSAKQI